MVKKEHHYSIEYQYDDLNRLVSANMDTGLQYHYAYDEVGNLVKIIVKHQIEQHVGQAESFQAGVRDVQQIDEPRWFILRDKNQYGPYAWNDLIGFKAQNRLFRNDLIWNKDLKEWTRAEKIEGLF